jgi:hypothetical protein
VPGTTTSQKWRADLLAIQQEFERAQTKFPSLYHVGMFCNGGEKGRTTPTPAHIFELFPKRQTLCWGDRMGGVYNYAYLVYVKEGLVEDADRATEFLFDTLKIVEPTLKALPQEVKEHYLARYPANLSRVENDYDFDWWALLYHLAWQKLPGLLRAAKIHWLSDSSGARMATGIEDIDVALATYPGNKELYPGCWFSELTTDVWRSCEHACRLILTFTPAIDAQSVRQARSSRGGEVEPQPTIPLSDELYSANEQSEQRVRFSDDTLSITLDRTVHSNLEPAAYHIAKFLHLQNGQKCTGEEIRKHVRGIKGRNAVSEKIKTLPEPICNCIKGGRGSRGYHFALPVLTQKK